MRRNKGTGISSLFLISNLVFSKWELHRAKPCRKEKSRYNLDNMGIGGGSFNELGIENSA